MICIYYIECSDYVVFVVNKFNEIDDFFAAGVTKLVFRAMLIA